MKKIIISLFLLSSVTHAFDISTKGFLTFAYRISDSEIAYKDDITEDGEYSHGTKAGLQFHSNVSKRNEAFIQLLANGEEGRDFNFALDIAHITFSYTDNHKLLYGKIRLPVWMISDYRQVGSLYPWVNPPEEVYEIVPLETVGVNDTFFGVSFEGLIYQSGQHRTTYRFYHGGGERSGPNKETRIRNLHGVLLNYSYGDLTLKGSYLNALSKGERTNDDGSTEDASFGRAEYFSYGFRYDSEYILSMAEYSQVLAENRSYEDVKSYYAMLGTYLNDQMFLLHATYSEVLDSSKSDKDIFQKTWTVGFNYNFDLNTVVKLEYKRVTPTRKPFYPPGGGPPNSAGLFERHPDGSVNFFAFSLNTMF